MKKKRNIVAIDPGLRSLGLCQFVGNDLTDFGVKSLRRPGDEGRRENRASLTFLNLLNQLKPDIILVEEIGAESSPRNLARLIVTKCIKKLAAERKVTVSELPTNIIRKTVAGKETAFKRQVRAVLCSLFPELREFGMSGSDAFKRYYQPMFDAVACAYAYLKLHEEKNYK